MQLSIRFALPLWCTWCMQAAQAAKRELVRKNCSTTGNNLHAIVPTTRRYRISVGVRLLILSTAPLFCLEQVAKASPTTNLALRGGGANPPCFSLRVSPHSGACCD